MHWHYHLGHLAFSKLKQLTLNGKIPQRLAKVKPPTCVGCLFGAMTKVPWKGQATSSHHQVFIATKAGQCVSVDQLISMQVGFIAQLKGSLTKKQYTTATAFVKHYSKLNYIHVMTKLTSEETTKQSAQLSTLPGSMASASSTTTATMDNLQTTLSRTVAAPRDNNSPFAGLMPTSKTALQKRPSATSPRA
jgi:hypothetical protein